MPYITVLCLILSAVSAVFSLYRQFQMLQQNSYFPSRYLGWVKESYTVELALCSIIYCAVSWCYLNMRMLIGTIAVVLLLAIRIVLASRAAKKSIKKLVFTARVKRLFGLSVATLFALIAVFSIIPHTMAGEICFMVGIALSLISPLLTLFAWAVTYPIESAVSRWYINDARRILREHNNLTVIGITGSYGKTTTKFILNRILSEKYNTVCTPQSFNTPMGVVRTVRGDIKPQTQMFICEMGAKKVGDIKEICDIAHPSFGIITSVGAQHLDTFRSEDNVFKTKFELFDAVKEAGGICLANIESAGIASRREKATDAVYFGEGTDYYAEDISYSANGSTFTLSLKGEKITVTTRLLGRHSITDILAAAALAHILGVSGDEIRFAISSLKPTEHRLELKPSVNGSAMIDDAYNSNPEGCLEAVRVLGHFEGKKKVIITPGLIELGPREYECNYALGLEATKHCDTIILVGKNRSKPMRDAIATTDFNPENVYVAASFAEAMGIYSSMANSNHILLIENDLPDNYLN